MEKKVILFFQKKTGLNNLNKGINIADPKYGIIELDAESLMLSFFNEFDIDSKDFDLYTYFQDFPNINWKYFINQILKRKKYIYPNNKKCLTIDHLVKVAEKGEWFKPEE
ncbi:Protein of unknown function (DUF1493) [Apibacter mensalis]|uniref:DUF1493 family protein n=1 Tax=Apibacter mensalis TaxID=1586267 RepID=A0A0X3AQ49_9FLAO|nr:DUF1493 family protein [Apibacter mensalis]CVK16165.1 Protein of unknown function (DUF1493) [Apibacter mensalis]